MTEPQEALQPLCFFQMATEVITMNLGQQAQPDAYSVISFSVQPHPGVSADVLFIQGQRAQYLKPHEKLHCGIKGWRVTKGLTRYAA